MHRAAIGTILLHSAACLAFGQAEAQPKFDIADVHVSPKSSNQFMRSGPVRGGRYEVRTATMVDLIRSAYGYAPDKILGGPSWLEMDRFDIIARVPADSTAETQKAMLQSLLEERFRLVLHKDTKPLSTYALTVGKKLQLKEATGEEQPACKPQSPSGGGGPSEGGSGVIRMMMSSDSGAPVTFTLGPGATIQYQCRNMTMAAFAAGMRGMMGMNLGSNNVLDETGLKGSWNFDVKFSISMNAAMMAGSDRITIFDALEKQLGLKLEEKQIPTPVIVVDSVNRTPSANPPGVAEALPVIPTPTEFEVASIKPAEPPGPMMMSRYQPQPGGRLTVQGMPLRFLINRAFNTNNNDYVVGLPAFVNTDRYDITAKAPGGGPSTGQLDNDALAPMMLSLLVDRFKLKYHTEERPVTAYTLVASKPKIKKADPATRTNCKTANAPAGAPPGSRLLICQNVTMAQFAERLQNLTPEISWPVDDATGLEGGWDFSLTFSNRPQMMMMGVPARVGGDAGGAAGAGPGAQASEPTEGYTLFEAIEKQLGLKLEKQKRSLPVIVVDHIEPKPTEN